MKIIINPADPLHEVTYEHDATHFEVDGHDHLHVYNNEDVVAIYARGTWAHVRNSEQGNG